MAKERKKRDPHYVDDLVIEENVRNSSYDDIDRKRLELFSKRLNNELFNQKIDQVEFYKKIGVQSGALSNYRNGSRFPQGHTLLRMADLLGVSTDYLMGKSKVKKYSNEDLNKWFGFTDNTIEILSAVAPKDSLNVMFDNDRDAVNYLLEQIQNYKDDLKALDEYKKNDKDYELKVNYTKVTKDIDFAKFRMQQALQSLVDKYYKKEIEEYNKK